MNGTRCDIEHFRSVYRQSVEDAFQFWTREMQEEVSRHCYGWREGATDFKGYLIASEDRYSVVYRALCESGSFESLCDVGGFYGVFPLTLARMGYKVAMTEALKYYSDSFTPLFAFLRDSRVRIIDYDPFDQAPEFQDRFDVVTVLAVLEHYPHSLRDFMDNVRQIMKQGGRVYIEVPNIAYWPKRKALLKGKTPLASIADIYRSEVPFIGHHHEFTLEELKSLIEMAGLEAVMTACYNYSFRGPLVKRLYSDLMLTVMTLMPSMRECVAIMARLPHAEILNEDGSVNA